VKSPKSKMVSFITTRAYSAGGCAYRASKTYRRFGRAIARDEIRFAQTELGLLLSWFPQDRKLILNEARAGVARWRELLK